MNTFFYRNWWLFYILFFLLLGILVYAFFWQNNSIKYTNEINSLNKELKECRDSKIVPAPEAENETPVKNVVDCNATVNSGGQGETITEHKLGNSSGTVVVDYDAQNIPDEFTVIYDGKIVASTSGLVAHEGSLTWEYNPISGKPDYCTVKVSAPNDKTNWSYIVNCPR